MELPDSIKAIGEQVEAGGAVTPATELFEAYPVFAAEVAHLFTRPWLLERSTGHGTGGARVLRLCRRYPGGLIRGEQRLQIDRMSGFVADGKIRLLAHGGKTPPE